ncbi:nodulin MtN21 /EamA-like transporter family protein [Actinidia rufa]|uniref:WAT1-related protein n=1 Tax=Actinidia rufa TaxID=165716 RepID=A0A7J0ESA4_9ERIC|nr:nodulin MtN21 /EamA-like transporter family protein [Actinidia rufa]
MGRVANTIHGLKPVMMMVVVQAALAGITIFYKIAGNIGMSLRVLIAYRFLIGAAFMVPLALVIERGSMAQNLYAESLVLTSATFAAAMTNLIPAITFILAISFGLERLGWGTMAGKAKVVGTLLCISGAMILTFYKGLEVKLWSTNVDLLHKSQHHGGHVAASHPPDGNHVLGALLVVCCCLSSAMGLIFQAKMVRNYPCPYSGTALVICMGAIQATVFALCMERDWNQWKLGWNIRLLTVTYSGIVASGLVYTFMTCCVQMRGPLFVSVFSPLMLVLVAIAGSLVLEEKLYMGSVLGAGGDSEWIIRGFMGKRQRVEEDCTTNAIKEVVEGTLVHLFDRWSIWVLKRAWGGRGGTEGSNESSIGQKWARGVVESGGDVEVLVVWVPPICRKGRIKKRF